MHADETCRGCDTWRCHLRNDMSIPPVKLAIQAVTWRGFRHCHWRNTSGRTGRLLGAAGIAGRAQCCMHISPLPWAKQVQFLPFWVAKQVHPNSLNANPLCFVFSAFKFLLWIFLYFESLQVFKVCLLRSFTNYLFEWQNRLPL